MVERGKGIRNVIRHSVLVIVCLIMFFPFLWMLSSALKTNQQVLAFPPSLWPTHPQWQNFGAAWTAAPFGLYLFNSIFTAGAIVLLQVINSAMMAYALTHMRFFFKRGLLTLVLSTYMLPVAATYLPSFIILSRLQLLNSYAGLILSNSVSVFAIFLVRQAFLQIPREVIEAARMDGARHWRILWQILVPLCVPTFIVMALLSFISNYNNYLWPMLITNNPNLNLVAAGLQSFYVQAGSYGMEWALIMAGSTITIIPLFVLFLFGQKWIMRGVNALDVNIG